jgi:3-oxoadipate enol-lactonase
MSHLASVTVVGRATDPPIVLSNALGTTSALWQPQLPALTPYHRVIVYEHAPLASVSALGAQVLDFADALQISRFSFCGLSLGGMVGMWLGVQAPDRVDKLVLACTSARFGSPEEWAERAAVVRKDGMSAVAHDALNKWFTPRFREREPFLRMQLDTHPEDYALGLEAIGSFDFRGQLDRLAAPTLVIAGAEDSATTTADAAFIAERIAGARLVVLDGAAHLANVEQAAAFNAALLEHCLRTRIGMKGPAS